MGRKPRSAYSKLNPRQKKFVTAYLRTNNKTEAARIAGYKHPNVQGFKAADSDAVRAAIAEKMADVEMGADEAAARLAALARSDLSDFLTYSEQHDALILNLHKARELGQLQAIKKYKETENITTDKDGGEYRTIRREVEVYDKQKALIDILKITGRYKHRVDLTTGDKELPPVLIYKLPDNDRSDD